MSRSRPVTEEQRSCLDGPRIMQPLIRIDGPGIDMSESLSDRFAAAQTNVIDVDGEIIFATYEVETLGDALIVKLERAEPEPVQGLRIKARDMLLEVNDHVSSDVVIWWDSAPSDVRVRLLERGPKASLRLWNVWRGGMDVIQAWLGNAGIQVDRRGRGVRLRCSDGVGAVNFSDQVLFVTVVESGNE